MKERPVLPEMSPARALREFFVVAFDVAAFTAVLLGLVVVAAFLLGRGFLGALAFVGMVLCGGAMARLHVAKKDLEGGWS